MALCPNCGKDNAENAIFCESCGTFLSGVYNTEAPVEPKAISKVRKIGSSPLMLVVAILVSVTLFASIPKLGGFNIPLMSLLECIGFWLIYSTCKKRDGMLMSTSGLTMLRVIFMLKIIFISIGTALMAVTACLLPTLVYYTNQFDPAAQSDINYLMSFSVVFFGAALTILIISIIRYILGYCFLGSVKDTVKTGFPNCRCSASFIVFTIISQLISVVPSVAVFIFKEQIFSFINVSIPALQDYMQNTANINISPVLPSQSSFNISAIISVGVSVFGLIVSILMIILVAKYRGKMNALKKEDVKA